MILESFAGVINLDKDTRVAGGVVGMQRQLVIALLVILLVVPSVIFMLKYLYRVDGVRKKIDLITSLLCILAAGGVFLILNA